MQSLGDSAYTKLKRIAEDRDITVQELIRAIVIPDWLKSTEKRDDGESQSDRRQAERRRRRVAKSQKSQIGAVAIASRLRRKP